MANLFKVDEFEPLQIEAIIKQAIPDTVRAPLNRYQIADYAWKEVINGELEQQERKQVSEIMADMESVEYQLLRYLQTSSNLTLIVEGILEPEATGCRVFQLTPNGRYFRGGYRYKTPYKKYEAWLIGLERQGVNVWRTASWVGTAHALVLWYQSAQREEHTTLNRHIKPKPDFHPDPHVMTLMNISRANLGPELAERLIKVFETPWKVMQQPPEIISEYIDGIGIGKAKQILQAFGREV